MARKTSIRGLRAFRNSLRREIDSIEDKMEETEDQEEYKRLAAERRAKRNELRDVEDDIEEATGGDENPDKPDPDKPDPDKPDPDKPDPDKPDKPDPDNPPKRQHWGDRRIFGRGGSD